MLRKLFYTQLIGFAFIATTTASAATAKTAAAAAAVPAKTTGAAAPGPADMTKTTGTAVPVPADTTKTTAAGAPAPADTSKMTAVAPPAPALSITGSADLYYRYDFAKQASNDFTSFTHSTNSFELGMAELKVEHKTDKLDMVADLGFGRRATEFAYNDQGILAAIQQLYISYSPYSWVKFTAGTWATHVGYEVEDAYANRNYSMSYMFTYGPFSHTGVRADFTSGKSGFMIGVSNPTDYRYVPEGVINKKFLIAQYSYAPSDNFKLYLNYVGGENVDTSKSNQFDVVINAKAGSKVTLGYNGTIKLVKEYAGKGNYSSTQNWWGSAVYVSYDPTAHFGLSLREEYHSDQDQLTVYSGFGQGGSVIGSTLSASFKKDGFTLIPEIRVDQASQGIFKNTSGAPTKTDGSFLIAAIYSF
jgi:hypothetical protein